MACPGKDAWPELVGENGQTAKETIERENPLVTANVALVGSPGTTDFRCDRVRVFVDRDNSVVQVPVIG
ncbi:glu S.griseus protease inhibitor-like [Nicotiana sylvestris]|uniref:Glu S.griseus protease inhibitor-like n=1 Tax=Nicotiana sylvestris TaxID=4096 RepID=A0A1U7WTT2_NICSY|nr:PREDICTED: glu S.griseus protease inhibitor-like [Nicotiana sylvestris]